MTYDALFVEVLMRYLIWCMYILVDVVY